MQLVGLFFRKNQSTLTQIYVLDTLKLGNVVSNRVIICFFAFNDGLLG